VVRNHESGRQFWLCTQDSKGCFGNLGEDAQSKERRRGLETNPRRGRIFSDIRRVRRSFEVELKSMRVVLTVNSTEPSHKARKTSKARPVTVEGQGGSSKGKRSCYKSCGTENESSLAVMSGRYRP
jgi:hypothetical protein